MRTTCNVRWLVFGLMMAFGFAPAVTGADITIPTGTDFLFTLPGSFYDFPAPIGQQALVGKPAFAGGTDTTVMRQADADATTGEGIKTLLTGLSLVGTGAFSNLSVTLDPNHLLDDTGTMSFLVTTPTTPGTVIGGTIADTLNVWFMASIPGTNPVFGHELFTSSGTWQAFLPANSNEVIDFKIIIDIHVDPKGVHVVSSSIPEPSSWVMLVAAGVMVSGYARWRRRRS